MVEYPISLVDLKKLVPHEMTIKPELERFKDAVQRDGSVFHPILVDRESLLILDGHHRHAGLLDLGYCNAPAIFLNYHDDTIVKLDTWYPLIEKDPDYVQSVFTDHELKVWEIQDLEAELEQLQSRQTTAIIGNQKIQYGIEGERTTIFSVVRDEWLENIKYYDNKKMCLQAAKTEKTAILSWPYTKMEILEYVKEGNIHYPKTTQHILTYRYRKCDYPLTGLARLD